MKNQKRKFLINMASILTLPNILISKANAQIFNFGINNINYLNKNSSIEKIFFANLKKILAQSKFTLTETTTSFTYKRILESIDLGLTQISLIPIEAYYDNFDHKGLGYIEYPFLIQNYNQFNNGFNNVSQDVLLDINNVNKESIAIGIMPYSFKILATNLNLNDEIIKNEKITFESNIVSEMYFKQFKKRDTINSVNKISLQDKHSIVETNLIDFFDNKIYINYKNIYLTNHALKNVVINISKQWWKYLNEQEKLFIRQSINSAIILTNKNIISFNQSLINQFEKNSSYKVIKVNYSSQFIEFKKSLNLIYRNSYNNTNKIKSLISKIYKK